MKTLLPSAIAAALSLFLLGQAGAAVDFDSPVDPLEQVHRESLAGIDVPSVELAQVIPRDEQNCFGKAAYQLLNEEIPPAKDFACADEILRQKIAPEAIQEKERQIGDELTKGTIPADCAPNVHQCLLRFIIDVQERRLEMFENTPYIHTRRRDVASLKADTAWLESIQEKIRANDVSREDREKAVHMLQEPRFFKIMSYLVQQKTPDGIPLQDEEHLQGPFAVKWLTERRIEMMTDKVRQYTRILFNIGYPELQAAA